MFRKKRYVHPFISRKPVRTPLTYIQIDQICRIELGIFAVALCEEGVDRNKNKAVDGITSFGRPLRRGRPFTGRRDPDVVARIKIVQVKMREFPINNR